MKAAPSMTIAGHRPRRSASVSEARNGSSATICSAVNGPVPRDERAVGRDQAAYPHRGDLHHRSTVLDRAAA